MRLGVALTGKGEVSLTEWLATAVDEHEPGFLGVVSAFLNVGGVTFIEKMRREHGVAKAALVVGTDGYITHPKALKIALEHSFPTRIMKAPAGIFHPKGIIAAKDFTDGKIVRPSFCYFGSANITDRGLQRNLELAFLSEKERTVGAFSDIFERLFAAARTVDSSFVDQYGIDFARVNRRRSIQDVEELVEAEGEAEQDDHGLITGGAPDETIVEPQYASAVWTGLESFTGAYTLQVEFPKEAAEILNRMVAPVATADRVPLLCDDGEVRDMKYTFYEDNGMFRLNIPNSVPGVNEARSRHRGVALVEESGDGGHLRLRIVAPERAELVVRRSIALGSWGRTPTRPYGWF